jgi:ABC-type bacteriocin/lantibiotic exporter with double-glycine peptidase domain
LLPTLSELLSSTRFSACQGVRKALRDSGPANISLFWFVFFGVFSRVRLLPCFFFFLFSTVFNLVNPFFPRDLDRSWLIYSIVFVRQKFQCYRGLAFTN